MPSAPDTFVHLHNHTEFSLLDGASRIKAMVARAAELGMPGLALTDHGVMYGAITFYKACRAAGIKPILGFEAYVAPRSRFNKEGRVDRDPFHLTLLAQNAEGYRNLMRLCSMGQMEGMYYKPRIDREILSQYSQGIICLSGCLGGEVAQNSLGDDDGALRETIATYRDIFTPERYFLEAQRHGIEEQEKVNVSLARMAKEFGLRQVVTNDLHYVHQHDAEAHDVLLCLQTGNNFDDPTRWRFESDQFFLKTPEEMRAAFEDLPDGLAATLDIADLVDLEIDMSHHLLPPFEVPAGHTIETYLRERVDIGLRWRYEGEPPQHVRERTDYELDVIRQTGYSSYFLIVWDFFNFARNNDVMVGPGRGSAAGSVVAYALGITDLDPIKHELVFERFLNTDRISMPDIDSDFSVEGRGKVINYVTERYGKDRVAQIATFTTMASKAAIRDVGRVLSVPLRETDRLAKLVPVEQGRSKSLGDAVESVPEFKEAYQKGQQIGPDGKAYDLTRLIDVAKSLEGVSRNVSTHAAGVVIAPDELVNYAPVQYGPGRDSVITQYDYKAVENIGLLKMDFLGLQNLDILKSGLELIKQHKSVEIDLQKLPLDDTKTFDLISEGDTFGVFQLESSGFRRLSQDLKPNCFADIAAMIALYRPGPMDSIPAYLARKAGREKVTYLHPKMEAVLAQTYGVLTYQEQVMTLARELAGFTLGEADVLRAAMGKKDAVKMASQREKFLDGCVANGIPRPTATAIADAIQKFASYGFNKAHAAAYGMIVYETAYLKANYAVEYMTGLLSNLQGNSDKVAAAIVDCRKRGLEVLPPDLNESGPDFTIIDETRIRFGLAAIKNVGRGPVTAIVVERERAGSFASLDDLCERLAGVADLNSRVLDSLIRSGACDVFGERALILASSERARQRADRARRDRESGQTSLFGLVETASQEPSDSALRVTPMGADEKLQYEKELLGLYLSDHPLNRLQDRLEELTDAHAIDITTELTGREVRVAGLIRDVRRVVTRKGQVMAFVQIEDLTGVIEATLFTSVFEQHRLLLEPDRIVVMQGKVEPARGGGPRNHSGEEEGLDVPVETEEVEKAALLPDFIWAWDDPDCVPVEREMEVHVDLADADPLGIDRVVEVIGRYPGEAPVLLHFTVESGSVIVAAGERYRVEAGPALKAALDDVCGRSVTRLEKVLPRARPSQNGSGAGNGHGRRGNENGNGRREAASVR